VTTAIRHTCGPPRPASQATAMPRIAASPGADPPAALRDALGGLDALTTATASAAITTANRT